MVTVVDLPSLQAEIARHSGRVLVVNHFATWCVACVDEMPLLLGLRDALRGEARVAFLGIAWETFMGADPSDAAETLRAFAEEIGIDFPILVFDGEPDALIEALSVESGTIPHTAVYDPRGKAALRLSSPLEDERDVRRVRDAVDLALAFA